MPPGAAAPVFPSASPTCACQSSAATARPGAPATRATNANCRTCNRMVILLQLSSGQSETAFSVELLHYLLERRSLKQGYFGHRISVLQLRIDAHRPEPGIGIDRGLGRV